MKKEDPRPKVVVSLLGGRVTILGGQEIRLGRAWQAISELQEFDCRLLCGQSLREAWERGDVGQVVGDVRVFSEPPSKWTRWLGSQLFAWRNIPRHSIIHMAGSGIGILPAAILARYLKGCTLITSLTTVRVKPLRPPPSWPLGRRKHDQTDNAGNNIDHVPQRFSPRTYWIIRAALKFSHRVDALNPQIDIANMVDGRKLSISPCSFSDPNRFRPAPTKRLKAVFAGHLNDLKGSRLLIEFVRHWPEDLHYELVICGSGPDEEKVRRAAATKSNVTVQRIWSVVDVLADAMVFLSLQELDNYPSQSLLEAMLSGCAVVATDVGDTRLLVQAPWGACIDLHAPAKAYVAAVTKFLELPDDRRQEIAQAARQFIVENHNRERYVGYLVDLWCKSTAHH